MFLFCRTCLCLGILLGEPGQTVKPWEEALWEETFNLAVQLEVTDTRYEPLYRNQWTASQVVHDLRKTFWETVEFPPLGDCKRFPPYEECRRRYEENWKFQQYLYARIAVDRLYGEWYEGVVLRETQRLLAVWQAVMNVNNPYCYVNTRRGYLQELRNTLGDRDYFRGEVPCHLPLQFLPVWD